MASTRAWHDAAELADWEPAQERSDLPRCARCGAFLPAPAEQTGFDVQREAHYALRTCRRASCAHRTVEWLLS
jgi:hypothetical protein